MRIAYLLSDYPHIRHAYLLREIRGLRELGLEIDVVALRAETRTGGTYTKEEREEIQGTSYILQVGAARILEAHLRTLTTRPRGYFRGVRRALRYGRLRPIRTLYALIYFVEAVIAGNILEQRGILHAHTHYLSTQAWMMSEIFGLAISMTLHGSGEFVDPQSFFLREKLAASSFAIAISEFGRSQILQSAPPGTAAKVEVCRLGVDPNFFTERPFRPDSRPFQLLSIGGMAPPRTFDVLIRALAELRSAGRDVVLRLVGDGPLRASLERMAAEHGLQDRVIFEGWKTQGELRPFYCQADVFVFSSLAEGIPVVLMEAMAQGIPCVASRITGIPELIRDGLDGFLVGTLDAKETARAVMRLMEDADLRRRMSLAARRHLVEEYNLPKNLEALAEIFRRRVGGRPDTGGHAEVIQAEQ